MNRLAVIVSLALTAIAPPAALADDVAAQRARLANDRIRAEEEQRARDEARRAEQAQAEQAQVEQAQAEQAQVEKPMVAAESRTPPTADRIEMTRALEQLRELGALKDAGYLTDEEFRLLKEKILDGAL
jgi:flagellar motility protein MotE (MotC chaperone)